jgi:hypothetical protein
MQPTYIEDTVNIYNIRFVLVDGTLKILLFNCVHEFVLEGDIFPEFLKSQTNGIIDSIDKFHDIWKNNMDNTKYYVDEFQKNVKISIDSENINVSIIISLDIRPMTYTEKCLAKTILNLKNMLRTTMNQHIDITML